MKMEKNYYLKLLCIYYSINVTIPSYVLCTHEPKYLNLENECVQYNYLSEIYLFLYHLCDCLMLVNMFVNIDSDSVNNLIKQKCSFSSCSHCILIYAFLLYLDLVGWVVEEVEG